MSNYRRLSLVVTVLAAACRRESTATKAETLLTEVVHLRAAADYTCASNTSSEIYCWGRTYVVRKEPGSAIAVDEDVSSSLPHRIAADREFQLSGVFDGSGRAVDANGNLLAWPELQVRDSGEPSKEDADGLTLEHVSGASPWRAVAIGMQASGSVLTPGLFCLRDAEMVSCLTSDASEARRFGIPSLQRRQWSQMPGLLAVTTFQPDPNHAYDERYVCFLYEDGRIECQLPDGPRVRVLLPSPARSMEGVRTLGALLENGTVALVGKGLAARIVPDLRDVVQLSVGETACALTSSHDVYCWAGDASRLNRVSGLDDPIAIAAGDHHACALQADGHVRCWGRNDYGQCGIGTVTPPATEVPPSYVLRGVDEEG